MRGLGMRLGHSPLVGCWSRLGATVVDGTMTRSTMPEHGACANNGQCSTLLRIARHHTAPRPRAAQTREGGGVRRYVAVVRTVSTYLGFVFTAMSTHAILIRFLCALSYDFWRDAAKSKIYGAAPFSFTLNYCKRGTRCIR